MKKNILFLIASGVLGILSGFVAVYLHRIGINWYFPIGFFMAILGLFALGVVICAYFGKLYTYFSSIVSSFTIYILATTRSGDILILGSSVDGEKSWAGIIGYILVFGSFFFIFAPTLLPYRFFVQNFRLPIYKTSDKDIDFMLALVNTTNKMLENAFFSGKYSVMMKSDNTPVTQIDQLVESFIRDQIHKKFPNDIILGEEYGEEIEPLSTHVNNSPRRWIIDPIDGTKNFIRGVPMFATLIALESINEDGHTAPIKSVVSAPILKSIWWGSIEDKRNYFAYSQYDNYPPKKCRVSDIDDISKSSLSISSRCAWANKSSNHLKRFDGLSKKVARVRGFGDFYSYMLLASGSVDIATEPDLELYDIAALIPIVKAAGGSFTDIDGNEWTSNKGINSAYATNSRIKYNFGE